ncbi:MAG TPA: aromatic amino acid lyase [Streptosporangiaceae bacterium]|nr:aromatic amino acid lyase [Streptosporangiaceae bacterium]
MSSPVVILDGESLTCAQVAEVARGAARVVVSAAGRARAQAAARLATELTRTRPVYGRTTGVGANRDQLVPTEGAGGNGVRLLRSHAGGGGPLIAAELSRAMLVVRANQLAAGGSGVDPAVLDVLAAGINQGLAVPVPTYGAIGTGDLTALAATALCLLGERDWLPVPGGDGAAAAPASQPRFALASADALAFISSNAATIGEAAVACHDLAGLLRASTLIAALSHLAVAASAEPYAAPVHAGRGRPGQETVARLLRELLAAEAGAPARIQDPYGYRALPQVHGAAADSVLRAEQAVTSDANAASENPLVDVAGRAVWHNGNFHTAYIGLALDAVRAALFQTAALSAARLGTLVEPGFTGLAPFLACDTAPSSGIMILEYVAHSAIADIRRLAAPAALGSAVLSRGVEEHAGFSTQSARATTDVITAYRLVLACELVAAVRALRMGGIRPAGDRLSAAFGRAAAALPADLHDRPLDDDLTIARDLLLPLTLLLDPS